VPTDADSTADETGATQGLAALQMGAPADAGQPQYDPGGAPLVPPTVPIRSIADGLFCDWLEDDILSHFPIVQAAEASQPSAAEASFQLPSDWAGNDSIFIKLGYHLDSEDHWRAIGYAMYEGPDPSVQLITSRLRTVKLLCSLVGTSGGWSPADLQRARDVRDKITLDVKRCEEDLHELMRARRKIKASKLPLWKELGKDGLELLTNTKPYADEVSYTQWSDVLAIDLAPNLVPTSRSIAELAEKGDDWVWEQLKGMAVTMWTHSDANALTRLLASLLRRIGSSNWPVSVRLIAPIPLRAGMDTASDIMDLWWSPLLGDRWASIVKGCFFVPHPFEMVLPGWNSPRHTQMGLAVFNLAFTGAKSVPRVMTFKPAILGLRAVTVDLLFPDGVDQLAQFLQLRHLRRPEFPESAFFGSTLMYSDPDAMTLEINGSASLHHYWQRPKLRNNVTDHIADIQVQGEVGQEDGDVLRRIFMHACSATGLALAETAQDAVPKPGGRLRILLSSTAEVRKVHAALHGQTVRAGTYNVVVEVMNAQMHLGSLPGNGRRGRAAGATHSHVLSHLALLISSDFFLLFLYSFVVIANCYLADAISTPALKIPRTVVSTPGGSRQGQCSLDVAASLWNAQALFGTDLARHEAEASHVHKLVARSNVCLLTETHGTDAGNATWRPPTGTTAWWSAGASPGHAGVGITAKNSFLQLFSHAALLEVIWPGRAAKLKLRGPHGALDIIVSYFPAGADGTEQDLFCVAPSMHAALRTFPALRAHLRNRLAGRGPWMSVFRAKGIDHAFLEEWLNEDAGNRGDGDTVCEDMLLEYERISGVRLNVGKTVCVSFFRCEREEVRCQLIREAPLWGALPVQDKAKYLGMVVGPGRGTSSLDSPCKKFVDRAVLWGQLGVGLLNTFVAYQFFVSSVVIFVAQLDPLPCSFDAIELQACLALFRGSEDWFSVDALKDLKSMSFAMGFPDVSRRSCGEGQGRQLHQLSRDARNQARVGHSQLYIDQNLFSLRDATTELTAAERQVRA
ncbi:unnamed protein product, partial [Prorocentrum cordatum]